MKIADLHTHPSFKPYHNRAERNNSYQNIWNGVIGRNSYFYKVPSLLRELFRETARDSQSSLNEFISGDLQTACAVIHPIERGWFMKPDKGRIFYKLLVNITFGKKLLSNVLASMTGIPLDRSRDYIETSRAPGGVDYFLTETLPEYRYIAEQQAISSAWQHECKIVKDSESYRKAKDEGKIPLLLTIEGGHALMDFQQHTLIRKKFEDLSTAEVAALKNSLVENVLRIKGKGNAQAFDRAHTPMYVTLVHMYQNFLAGHAKTYKNGGLLPDIADLLDQKAGLNESITSLGWEVIELLTSSENGSRILIDVKHMSVKARNEYYEYAEANNLPVIASHVAMAGVEEFHNDPKDSRRDHKRYYFSRWSINLSDHDVRIIHQTDGILGLALHEGRMPGGKANKKIKQIKDEIKCGYALEEHLRAEYLKLIASNIFQIVLAIGEKKAWTRIMIGSDFDGVMNPFDVYPSTGYFKRFLYDFERFLHEPVSLVVYRKGQESTLSILEIQQLMFGYSPEEICQLIALGNFENFIERHL